MFYAVNRDLLLEHGIALSEDDFFNWYLAENYGAWHILLQNGLNAEEISALRDERNRRYSQRLLQEGNLAIEGCARVLASCAARVPMGVHRAAQPAEVVNSMDELAREIELLL